MSDDKQQDATQEQVIEVHLTSLDANLSPYAFQHYAKDFYAAYQKHRGGPKFSPARLSLLARSIELAAKALHVHQGRSAAYLRRRLGHDLVKACKPSVLQAFGITLTAAEKAELKRANAFHSRKGFEYFWFDLPGVAEERSGPQMALSGWPGLPDEPTLEGILDKLLAPGL